MTTTTTKEKVIDSYKEFDEAVMEIHRNIDQHPSPTLEVSEKVFSALVKGHDVTSMTWGKPGIRVFPVGKMEAILDEESMPADRYREVEINRAREKAKKK